MGTSVLMLIDEALPNYLDCDLRTRLRDFPLCYNLHVRKQSWQSYTESQLYTWGVLIVKSKIVSLFIFSGFCSAIIIDLSNCATALSLCRGFMFRLSFCGLFFVLRGFNQNRMRAAHRVFRGAHVKALVHLQVQPQSHEGRAAWLTWTRVIAF